MLRITSFMLRLLAIAITVCPSFPCFAERSENDSTRFQYVVQYATCVGGDAYLARISADGSKILAATYFGGSKQERGVDGMLLDSQGNIVIGSATRSPDMPTTGGAYQTRYGGPDGDMYAAKLPADLTKVLWCTYFGASHNDWPRGGIALDRHDNVILVGGTKSKDFVTTENAYQRALKGQRDAAIVKLSADGSRLIFRMVTLLVYSYCLGVFSSRKIAAARRSRRTRRGTRR